MIALAVAMSFVEKTTVFVRHTAIVVILIQQTVCALSVQRHVINAMIRITVLIALKAHIFNNYLKTSTVLFVLQDVQAAPVTPHVHNAIIHTTGERTVRTTVSIALATVIKDTVAPQGALMNIIRPTMYQKVDMNVTSALHHVLLVRVCYIVRNAKTVSTAKQIMHVLNVLLIVKLNLIAINRMDFVRTVVVMVGLEISVTNPAHTVALYVSKIILAHAGNAVQACMETSVKTTAVGTVNK